MSLYENKVKIDGVPCGLITRGLKNGTHTAVFGRESASLEDVEAINWRSKTVGPCEPPQPRGIRRRAGTASLASKPETSMKIRNWSEEVLRWNIWNMRRSR